MVKNGLEGEIPPPPQKKNHPILMSSAHNHIPRKNPAKFHDNLMDSSEGVADNIF